MPKDGVQGIATETLTVKSAPDVWRYEYRSPKGLLTAQVDRTPDGGRIEFSGGAEELTIEVQWRSESLAFGQRLGAASEAEVAATLNGQVRYFTLSHFTDGSFQVTPEGELTSLALEVRKSRLGTGSLRALASFVRDTVRELQSPAELAPLGGAFASVGLDPEYALENEDDEVTITCFRVLAPVGHPCVCFACYSCVFGLYECCENPVEAPCNSDGLPV